MITKLRQVIGPGFDSFIARVGTMRVRSTEIISDSSLPSGKQIREAMNALEHQSEASRDNSL